MNSYNSNTPFNSVSNTHDSDHNYSQYYFSNNIPKKDMYRKTKSNKSWFTPIFCFIFILLIAFLYYYYYIREN